MNVAFMPLRTMDLISLLLTLRPLTTDRAAQSLPTWWGRAAHALLLQAIGRDAPDLATALHQGSGPRPFTASTLMGRMAEGKLDSDGVYRLRFTGLTQPVSGALLAATAEGASLAAGARLELDYQPFRVETAHADGHVWTGQDSYTELAAASLAGDAPRRLDMLLVSPTSFRSAGRHVPLPLPELVFGSLLERWNAFSPVAFPSEAKRYAAECLGVARYRLRSRPVPVKGDAWRPGALGQITYVALTYDRYWMAVLQTLARFALYSGIGAGTASGQGQARLSGERAA
ncbi:MAG: CRISPR system precrRNA processing endoribonuclease RAMP protein Cas6 [Anaerolineae bacterium]|nr:CRISPR system precrRNA processing endoribonuclease RAMP protein Cas6 [Anaerolineae bacterium]